MNKFETAKDYTQEQRASLQLLQRLVIASVQTATEHGDFPLASDLKKAWLLVLSELRTLGDLEAQGEETFDEVQVFETSLGIIGCKNLGELTPEELQKLAEAGVSFADIEVIEMLLKMSFPVETFNRIKNKLLGVDVSLNNFELKHFVLLIKDAIESARSEGNDMGADRIAKSWNRIKTKLNLPPEFHQFCSE